MFAKVDAYLRRGTAEALALLAAGLLFWAGALLLIQCTTWLKTGIWQPVPVFAVLLSPEAQTANLRFLVVPGEKARLFPGAKPGESWIFMKDHKRCGFTADWRTTS